MIARSDAQRFFEALFGGLQTGWLNLWVKGKSKVTYSFNLAEPNALGAAADKALAESAGADVYFEVCPQSQRPAGNKRGCEAGVSALVAVWLDVDLAGSNHKDQNLPPTQAEALKWLGRFALEPSAVIDTGGGLHPYWFLSEPFAIDSVEDRKRARALVERLQDAFRTALNPDGWHLDKTADLARVLRAPETLNHKTNPPKPTQILELRPERRYSIEQLEAELAKLTPPAESPAPKPERPAMATAARGQGRGRGDKWARARAYMSKVEPVPTGGRNLRAYELSCKLSNDFDLGEDGFELLADWNSRNPEPLSDSELRTPFKSAISRAKGPRGAALAEDSQQYLALRGITSTLEEPKMSELNHGEATSLDLAEDPGPDPWVEDPLIYEDRAVKAPEWEPPIPLDGRPEKPKFPIGALPGLAQEYALAVAEAFQVPVSYATFLILGCVSTATLKRVVLDPGRGPTCALNEYFLAVLESGSGKSSSLSQVFGPIYRWEHLMTGRDQAPDGQVNEVGILSSDPTPEALENRLRANNGRMGIANPEAADLFSILAGRYMSKGSGANIGLFLKGYSGDHHRSDRVLRGATLIREPRLTLTLALQPSAFEQVCGSVEFRERGFMARFLVDAPESLLGHRKLDPTPVKRDLSDRWGILVNGLLGIDPPKNRDNELDPFLVPVSPQANTCLRHFREWAEEGLRPEGYWSECREFGARAAEHVLKLTGLVHCLKHSGKPWEYPVSEETMVAGIELFSYFSEHVRQAAGSAVERRREDRLEYLLGRIRSKAEWKTSFKARDLLMLVKKTRGFESIENLLPDLERLCQFGYLQKFETKAGGRPSLGFMVSPWVHTSQNHPQYPQPEQNPYCIRLAVVGDATHNHPQKTHNHPQKPMEQNGTQEPFVGNVGIVGDPAPTTRTHIPQGFEGDCGYCGSLSEKDTSGVKDPTLFDLVEAPSPAPAEQPRRKQIRFEDL